MMSIRLEVVVCLRGRGGHIPCTSVQNEKVILEEFLLRENLNFGQCNVAVVDGASSKTYVNVTTMLKLYTLYVVSSLPNLSKSIDIFK